MYYMLKKKIIYPAFVSKHNPNCKKQVIILMILWFGDYCLNCLHSFRTKKKLYDMKKCMKIKIFAIV